MTILQSVKFTQYQDKRQIRVRMSVSRTDPSENDVQQLRYLPRTNISDGRHQPGTENSFYLLFSVQDTGCGISEEGQQRLFEKFTQESTRTYARYGGSGLGLFISRQVCSLIALLPDLVVTSDVSAMRDAGWSNGVQINRGRRQHICLLCQD